MFLTEAELADLSGWKRRSRQIEWLRTMGIRHYIRRDGRPIVLRTDLSAPAQESERTASSFATARRGA